MNTLRRPMFRRGGSAGEGITSGLSRPGYNRGRVVNPGGYGGEMDWANLMKGYPEFRKEYQQHVGPRPKSTNLNDFLINFGLNMASASPTGSVIQTAAAQAKEPFGQFQQQKAYEQASKRDEERDLIKSYISSRAEMLGGESAASIFRDEKIAGLAKETLNTMFAHDDAWKPEWSDPTKLDKKQQAELTAWEREKKRIDSDLDQFEEQTGIDLEFIIKESGSTDALMNKFKTELLQNDNAMTNPDGTPMVDEAGETITVSDYYTDTANAGDLQIKLIEMISDQIAQMKSKRRGWKHAQGGRAGYQQGELVEQADVNVMTPQGDVAMQETVEEGAEPDQLSYEELRARLPVEITDDIIRLMVNSAEALTDFAQIQTQQDVDNFNAKYGVNLVLPSEA